MEEPRPEELGHNESFQEELVRKEELNEQSEEEPKYY